MIKKPRNLEDALYDVKADAKLIGQSLKHAAEKAARPFQDLMNPPTDDEKMKRAILDVWHIASKKMRGQMKPLTDFVDENLEALKQKPITGSDSLRQHLEDFSRDMNQHIDRKYPQLKGDTKTTVGLVVDLFKHCIEAVKIGGAKAWSAVIETAEKLRGHSHGQSKQTSMGYSR